MEVSAWIVFRPPTSDFPRSSTPARRFSPTLRFWLSFESSMLTTSHEPRQPSESKRRRMQLADQHTTHTRRKCTRICGRSSSRYVLSPTSSSTCMHAYLRLRWTTDLYAGHPVSLCRVPAHPSAVRCRDHAARKGPRTVWPDEGGETPDRESRSYGTRRALCGKYSTWPRLVYSDSKRPLPASTGRGGTRGPPGR